MKEESAKKIIDKIKKEKIRPKQKWHFVARRALFWLVLGFVIALASMFLSLAILSFVDFDLELLRALHFGRYVRLLVLTAPYLWIIMLVGCIILGYYVFSKTKKGYRYSMLLVAMVILLVVSVLGVSAHFTRMNERMEQAISSGPRFLGKIAPCREHRFLRPDEGILAGKVIEKELTEFKLLTPSEELWDVLYNEQTIYRHEDIEVDKGVIVVVGEKIGEREFVAERIKKLMPPGRISSPKGGGMMNLQQEPPRNIMPGKAKNKVNRLGEE